MTFAEKMTAIADKIRILAGSSQGMDLDLMASSLEAEKTNVANAFTAIASMGGTLPSSQVSANLEASIESINKGITVKRDSGSVNVSVGSGSISCGFKPDFVYLSKGESANGALEVMGFAFAEANQDILDSAMESKPYLYFCTATRSSNGFSLSSFIQLNADYSTTNFSGSVSYVAIKYT